MAALEIKVFDRKLWNWVTVLVTVAFRLGLLLLMVLLVGGPFCLLPWQSALVLVGIELQVAGLALAVSGIVAVHQAATGADFLTSTRGDFVTWLKTFFDPRIREPVQHAHALAGSASISVSVHGEIATASPAQWAPTYQQIEYLRGQVLQLREQIREAEKRLQANLGGLKADVDGQVHSLEKQIAALRGDLDTLTVATVGTDGKGLRRTAYGLVLTGIGVVMTAFGVST